MDTSTGLISLSKRVKALRNFFDKPAGRLSYEELTHLLVLEGLDLMNTTLPGTENTLLKLVATPIDRGFQVDDGKETIPYRMLKLPFGVESAAVIATTSRGASSLGSSLWCYDVLMIGYWANGDLAWLGTSIWVAKGSKHPPFDVKALEEISEMEEFFDKPEGLEHFNANDVYDSYHTWLESRLDGLRKAEAALVSRTTIVGMRRDAVHRMFARTRQKEIAATMALR